MIRCLLICLLFATPLCAGIGDFPGKAARPPLFAADESTEMIRKSSRAPGGQKVVPAEVDTGWIGIAAWVNPFMRFPFDPDAFAAGVGGEVAFHFTQGYAVTLGIAGYTGYVDTPIYEEPFGGFEAELGLRWRFHRWDGGSIYVDMRGVFAGYDGPEPVRHTWSAGGGFHFGWEFGGTVIRGFAEGGMSWRAALNYRNSGWLATGDRNGVGGLHWDIIRIGLRVYV